MRVSTWVQKRVSTRLSMRISTRVDAKPRFQRKLRYGRIRVPGSESIKVPRRVSIRAQTSEKVKLDEGSNEIPMRFKYGIRKRVPMRTPKKVYEKGCDDGSDRMMEKGFTRVLC